MKNKRILTLTFVVVAIALLFSGCGLCPEIPECPDCVCAECPDCICPDIPGCPNIPGCPDCECPDCDCPDIPYLFTNTQHVNDGTVGDLVTTVTEENDWIVWTFDFPVEQFTGDGNLNVGLVIALDGEGQGPAFQIHNNDGATLVEPHGTWMYGSWGPTINDGWFGWPNHDLDVPVTSLDWVEAFGDRKGQGTDGVMEIRIKKSELGNTFHWAASPTVGTGFWAPASDVTMQIPTAFGWSTPIVDMNVPNYIAR